MKILHLLLFFFVIHCFSCSITKRRYMPGYKVDWNINTKSQCKSSDSNFFITSSVEKQNASVDSLFKNENLENKITLGSMSSLKLDSIVYQKIEKESTISTRNKIVKNRDKEINKKRVASKQKSEVADLDSKKTEPFGVASLIGAILIALIFFAFTAVLSDFTFLCLGLVLLTITFSILSIIRIRKKTTVYKGIHFPVIALILSLGSIIAGGVLYVIKELEKW